MTLRLLFFLFLFCLSPLTGFAEQWRTVGITFSFDKTNIPDGATLEGFSLFEDDNIAPACETGIPTQDPSAAATAYTFTCEIYTYDGTHNYQLAARYAGPVYSKSKKITFVIGGEIVGTPPPVTTPPPTGTDGPYSISSSWDTSTTDSTVAGYRMYMNDTSLCETSDPMAKSLDCNADLINGIMKFSMVSYNASDQESEKSNFLILDPADFPEIFQKKATTFNWEYTNDASNASGFQIFNNGELLCQTNDSTARSLSCTLGILLPEHQFTLAAVSSTGELTNFSNTILYSDTSGSSTIPPLSDELAAVITAPTTTGPTPLAISFSGAKSTGNITGYSWSFGDGDQATGQSVSHTYGVAGSYSATLEITDANSNTALASITIKADAVISQPVPPTAVISSSTAAGEAPLSITFDGSGSTANNATLMSYDWDFGDGTKGTGKTTSHTFTIAGTYDTELLVTDSSGLNDTENTPVIVTPATTVNQAPIASFSATPSQGSAPFTVSFNASASQDPDGNIANYSWNFGDGSKGSGNTIQHTYTTAASYTATLQVTDDFGDISPITSKTIIVEEAQTQVSLNYEIGELILTHEWVTVKFENSFNNPAVFISPPTNNDKEAVITRVRNLGKTGFDIRLQEWDYLDGVHAQETVSFLALEQGLTTLPDGTTIEAGTFPGSVTKQTISFKQQFTTTPVVFTTIISNNEADAVVGRISAVKTTSFAYLMQEQEKTMSKHINESVAYLAWNQGAGSADTIQFLAAIPTTTVTNTATTITFHEPLQALPFLFIEQQTMNGGDTASIRLQAITAKNFDLFLQEEQSKDRETTHVAETVGYLGISAATEVDKEITYFWKFEESLESTIKGFRLYNNENLVCETLNPAARELSCIAQLNSSTNNFTIRTIETNGDTGVPSNIIQYTP